MTVGAIAVAGVLFAAGVPGAVLLGIAPALLCVGMHLIMGHGDAHGDELLRTAQAAAARQAERPLDGVPRAAGIPPRSIGPR
jgi:4-hydroxybenzoate polyprenyltransferase